MSSPAAVESNSGGYYGRTLDTERGQRLDDICCKDKGPHVCVLLVSIS